jgi:hypothetical protein
MLNLTRYSRALLNASMLGFIFPFLGSCPMASRHGQWPDPWAGVTECGSLLAGYPEITGGGERLFYYHFVFKMASALSKDSSK